MVKEKNIQIEKITYETEIRNINDLKILYLEITQDNKILRQLEQIDNKKNNLKQLYLYFQKEDDEVLL